jgi:hypothetical protein
MATPSKNQRSGPKVKQAKRICPKGHEQTWVNYAARGRKNMRLVCECDGYAPIATNVKARS